MTSSQLDNGGIIIDRQEMLSLGWVGEDRERHGKRLQYAGSPARQRYTQKVAIGPKHGASRNLMT